jgi:hypothetical protein
MEAQMLRIPRQPYSEGNPDRAEAELSYWQILTLGRFGVLGAMFLSGVAIAANAGPLPPANPRGAVGIVANAAVSSHSPGREVAARPPANTAAPDNVTLPEVSVFGGRTHPYTSRLGPKASPNGTLTMDHYPVPPEYATNVALHPYTSHLGPKVSSNELLRTEHYQLPPDYAKNVAMHPYSSHLGPCIASCKILDRISPGTQE